MPTSSSNSSVPSSSHRKRERSQDFVYDEEYTKSRKVLQDGFKMLSIDHSLENPQAQINNQLIPHHRSNSIGESDDLSMIDETREYEGPILPRMRSFDSEDCSTISSNPESEDDDRRKHESEAFFSMLKGGRRQYVRKVDNLVDDLIRKTRRTEVHPSGTYEEMSIPSVIGPSPTVDHALSLVLTDPYLAQAKLHKHSKLLLPSPQTNYRNSNVTIELLDDDDDSEKEDNDLMIDTSDDPNNMMQDQTSSLHRSPGMIFNGKKAKGRPCPRESSFSGEKTHADWGIEEVESPSTNISKASMNSRNSLRVEVLNSNEQPTEVLEAISNNSDDIEEVKSDQALNGYDDESDMTCFDEDDWKNEDDYSLLSMDTEDSDEDAQTNAYSTKSGSNKSQTYPQSSTPLLNENISRYQQPDAAMMESIQHFNAHSSSVGLSKGFSYSQPSTSIAFTPQKEAYSSSSTSAYTPSSSSQMNSNYSPSNPMNLSLNPPQYSLGNQTISSGLPTPLTPPVHTTNPFTSNILVHPSTLTNSFHPFSNTMTSPPQPTSSSSSSFAFNNDSMLNRS